MYLKCPTKGFLSLVVILNMITKEDDCLQRTGPVFGISVAENSWVPFQATVRGGGRLGCQHLKNLSEMYRLLIWNAKLPFGWQNHDANSRTCIILKLCSRSPNCLVLVDILEVDHMDNTSHVVAAHPTTCCDPEGKCFKIWRGGRGFQKIPLHWKPLALEPGLPAPPCSEKLASHSFLELMAELRSSERYQNQCHRNWGGSPKKSQEVVGEVIEPLCMTAFRNLLWATVACWCNP